MPIDIAGGGPARCVMPRCCLLSASARHSDRALLAIDATVPAPAHPASAFAADRARCHRIQLGLVKKVILADSFAQFVPIPFGAVAAGHHLTLVEAWAAALSYAFQIYFDFSGYSDMAIGLALLFGIALPFNFNSPYKADSIIEFWRRWHITLSSFLRDYLYIPLGGIGPARRVAMPTC